jgi:hypothetical protein
MDPDRKRQILNAEERFTLRERLSRALAERGVYVVGRLTTEPGPFASDDDAADGTTAPSPPPFPLANRPDPD